MLFFSMMLILAGEQTPLSLSDCIHEALIQHPDIVLSQIDIQRADAQKLSTRSGYLPRLDLSIQDSYTFWGQQEGQQFQIMGQTLDMKGREAGDDDFHAFGLTLTQNILDGGKWWNRISRADQERSRTEISVEVVRQDVAMRVIQAFYQVLKARKQEEVLIEALYLSRDQLRLAEERKQVGDASKVDVAKAKVSVGEDEINLERQRAVIESALVDLGLAMGRKDFEPFSVEEAGAPEPILATERESVMESHPKLHENLLAQSVAETDQTIAEGDRWPTIQGSISYFRQNPEFYKVYSRFDMYYNLNFTLNISFPIFDAFTTESKIETAKVQREALQEQGRLVRNDLDARLSRSKSDLSRLQTVARLQTENVKAAQEQLELARERYALGDGTTLEVRDAQLAVTRAKLNEVQTQYEIRGAIALVHYASGDLLSVYLGEEHP